MVRVTTNRFCTGQEDLYTGSRHDCGATRAGDDVAPARTEIAPGHEDLVARLAERRELWHHRRELGRRGPARCMEEDIADRHPRDLAQPAIHGLDGVLVTLAVREGAHGRDAMSVHSCAAKTIKAIFKRRQSLVLPGYYRVLFLLNVLARPVLAWLLRRRLHHN